MSGFVLIWGERLFQFCPLGWLGELLLQWFAKCEEGREILESELDRVEHEGLM